jgi:uncharacterized protein YraI
MRSLGFRVKKVVTVLGKLFPIAAVTATLALQLDAFAGDKNGSVPQFTTTDYVNLRQGPGTNWRSIGVIPPATRVNVDHCVTSWSVGWCRVSYEDMTGYAHSSLLQILRLGKTGKVKPKFLIQAQKNYKQAQSAVKTAKQTLDRLLQTEAQQSQSAMAKTGSWIEPQGLWQKIRAAEQNLAFVREQESQARAALDNAEDKARSIWESNWSQSHQPSWWESW